jgi:hypothetical protein
MALTFFSLYSVNGRVTLNGELKGAWKEVAVAWFKVMSQHLLVLTM